MNDISWGGGRGGPGLGGHGLGGGMVGGGVEKSCAHFLWSPYRQVRLSARGSKASWRSVLLRYHRVTTLHTPPLHTIDVDVNTNINISNNLTIILRLNHRVKIVLNISLYKRPHKLKPQIINANITMDTGQGSKLLLSTTLTSWTNSILSIKHIVTLMITTSEQGPPGSQHDWIDWSVIERCTFERMSGRACGINLWIDLPWTIEQLYHCSIWITRICDEEG